MLSLKKPIAESKRRRRRNPLGYVNFGLQWRSIIEERKTDVWIYKIYYMIV